MTIRGYKGVQDNIKICVGVCWGLVGRGKEGEGEGEGGFRDPGVLKVSGMDVKSLGIDIYNCQN